MAKEIIAIALLILVFVATVINSVYLDNLVEEIIDTVRESEKELENGDSGAACEKLMLASDKWTNTHPYMSVLVRHAEIDITTDLFADVLIEIECAKGNSAKFAYEKLKDHLESIAKMERISLGTVF